jgi:hypothetical protein
MGKPVISTKQTGVKKELEADNGATYVDKPEAVLPLVTG